MKNKLFIFITFALSPFTLFAQAADSGQGSTIAPGLLIIIYTITSLLLLVTFFLWRVSVHLKKFMKGEFESAEQKMYDKRTTLEKIFQVKPVGTDKDVMLDHDYDGIKELDNPAPPWFMFLFYGTIVIAIIYFVRFSIIGSGPTQLEEYNAQMAEAETQQANILESQDVQIDESSVTLLTDNAAIDAGKKYILPTARFAMTMVEKEMWGQISQMNTGKTEVVLRIFLKPSNTVYRRRV